MVREFAVQLIRFRTLLLAIGTKCDNEYDDYQGHATELFLVSAFEFLSHATFIQQMFLVLVLSLFRSD